MYRILLLLVSLLSALPAVGGEPALPPGVSADEWQAIRTQLPGARHIVLTPSFAQQAYLKAGTPQAEAYLGWSVAISGDILAVGAPFENEGALVAAGAVHVFVREGAHWRRQARIVPNPVSANDGFGHSVAISGDTLVAGAPYEDNAAGAAYVFVRNGEHWNQQAYLKAGTPQAEAYLGRSVAISGNTVVVGAAFEDGGGSNAGAAYVFTRSNGLWTQQTMLKASNPGTGDLFGYAVAISGNYIVVGAPGESSDGSSQGDNSAQAAGAAYVFELAFVIGSAPVWQQRAWLKADNAESFDTFGDAVAISGRTLVVGAPGEDGNANNIGASGAAYVFVRGSNPLTGNWTQSAYLKAGNAGLLDSFGAAVAVAGDVIAVSAPYEDSDGSGADNDNLENSGAVYVFVGNGGSWTETHRLKAHNPGDDDRLGYAAVALSGDTLVAGAIGEASASDDPLDDSAEWAGAAYVFGPHRDGLFADGFE